MANNIQELIECNIMSLNKTQLQAKTIELQEALKAASKTKENSPDVSFLLSRFETLEKKQENFDIEINELKKENKKLKERLNVIDLDLDDAEERFIELEKSINKCEQYTRRENFEISGIPDTLPQEELEKKVIDIVNSITNRDENVKITPNDIHACHRLKKEKDEVNSKIIVRMVNRKDTIDVLKNKKKLKDNSVALGFQSLFINENLSTETKQIYDMARALKKKALIYSCWTYNGIVHIKKKETHNKGIKIVHISDFEDHFSSKSLGWD